MLTIEDLESINGTFLNGKRITSLTVVRSGDRLTVGPATFLIELDVNAKTPEKGKTVWVEIKSPAQEEQVDYVLDESVPILLPEEEEEPPPRHPRK